MSHTNSHLLTQEKLRSARRQVQMRTFWLKQREIIEDKISREQKKLIGLIRENENFGKIYRETGSVSFWDSTRNDQLHRLMVLLYEVRESAPMFNTYLESDRLFPELQRAALRVEAKATAVIDNADTLVASAKVMDIALAAPPVFPPGVENIHKSPRRPGAPATPAV